MNIIVFIRNVTLGSGIITSRRPCSPPPHVPLPMFPPPSCPPHSCPPPHVPLPMFPPPHVPPLMSPPSCPPPHVPPPHVPSPCSPPHVPPTHVPLLMSPSPCSPPKNNNFIQLFNVKLNFSLNGDTIHLDKEVTWGSIFNNCRAIVGSKCFSTTTKNMHIRCMLNLI